MKRLFQGLAMAVVTSDTFMRVDLFFMTEKRWNRRRAALIKAQGKAIQGMVNSANSTGIWPPGKA